jgi:hypothetical protein
VQHNNQIGDESAKTIAEALKEGERERTFRVGRMIIVIFIFVLFALYFFERVALLR